MLLNKGFILSALLVLGSTVMLKAQMAVSTTNDSAQLAEARKVKYLKGLRKISSDKELKYVDSVTQAKEVSESDILLLSQDYQKMHPYLFKDQIDNSHYKLVADIYVDSSSVIRAKVARPSTQKEQEKGLADLKKLIDESTRSPQGQEREKIISAQIGKPAPLFSRPDVDGINYDLSQLKGKVVVLNFWFIGCAPCKREMPELNALVEKYKSNDVVFLAFEVNDNSPGKVKAVARDFKYTQITSTRKEGDVASKYNIKTYPTSYVIDQAGVVRFGLSGYNPFRLPEMDKTIEGLLKKKPLVKK